MRAWQSAGDTTMMMQVLIVENDIRLAKILKEIVELDGTHTVTAIASDLPGVIDASASHPPDIALVDLNLGVSSTGMEVAVQLGKLGIPCLFSTAYPLPFPVPELAIGCLTKPYNTYSMAQSLIIAERIINHQSIPEDIPCGLELY